MNNNLHIITCLYRFDNLPQIYNSILCNDDIIWHIAKSNRRESLEYDFLFGNGNIKVYDVDCEDYDTSAKRNVVLNNINNGYFCFLDDDTVFHEKMYNMYVECSDMTFRGMLIGTQVFPNNKIRLTPSIPIMCKIDTGNVLAHHSCLEQCKWPLTHTPRVNEKDFLFWTSVYEYYDKKCILTNEVISYYNALRPEPIPIQKRPATNPALHRLENLDEPHLRTLRYGAKSVKKGLT